MVESTSVVTEDSHSIPDRHMHMNKTSSFSSGKEASMMYLVWGRSDLETRQPQQV